MITSLLILELSLFFLPTLVTQRNTIDQRSVHLRRIIEEAHPYSYQVQIYMLPDFRLPSRTS